MNLRTFLIRNQSLSILCFLSITSCGHGPVPKWDGKIWAGDSKRAGIVREQDAEFISASDSLFDDYAAVTYADLRKLYVIFQSCKQWKHGTQMMSAGEALQRFDLLIKDLDREKKFDESQ